MEHALLHMVVNNTRYRHLLKAHT